MHENTKDFPKVPFPTVIDNTMRSTFVSCERKAFFEYFHHWKTAIPKVDLHAGAAYAKGLEAARKAHWGAEKVPPKEALAQGMKALIEYWGEYQEPEGHVKSLDRMCGALVYYFDVFGWDTDHLQPFMMKDGEPAVEFSFALPIPGVKHPETGEDILYAGRFDQLAMYNGQLFVEDDKTTKSLGASWANQWTHRSQFTGYCWGAKEFGYPVAGAMVRGISILKTKYGNAESLQFRPEWQIDRWLEQLRQDVYRMIYAWENNYWGYDLADACGSYGGCLFSDICSQQNELRAIESNFVQRVWDPITHTEHEITSKEKGV